MNSIEQVLHKAYRDGDLSGNETSLIMACLLMCKNHLDKKHQKIFTLQYGTISAELLEKMDL